MRLGMHVVQCSEQSSLVSSGLSVAEPALGILDALRMVEGHQPEPPERAPLGLVGLDALLRATPGPGTGVLQAVRAGLIEGRRYFAWKEIPVVLLLDGRVDDADGRGLVLSLGEREWQLAPLLGTGFQPVVDKAHGWWWAPQLG